MTENTHKTNPSLQKKSAARTAAVQCLYRQLVMGEQVAAATQVEALKNQLANNKDEQKLLVGMAVEPNYTLVENLLSGVEQWRYDIDRQVDTHLNKDWTRARMSPLLIAILQCAIFEMIYFKDMNKRIAIDEYTRLTRSFLTESEADFVHGLLSAVAQKHG